MSKIAVLKPLRGTSSTLANVILEKGEIAFEYPSSGPGKGTGKIKMGDGSTKYSNLPDYIKGVV